MKDTMDEVMLARLAREMAMNVRNYKVIFADYGISELDYAEIERNEYFRKVKDQLTLEWNATTSTSERLQIGTLAYLEKLLPAITRRALDDETPLPAATEVGKLLQKMSGTGEPKSDKNNLERFVITLNLGGDVERYDKPLAVQEALPLPIEDGGTNGKADRKGKKGAAEL